MFAPALSGWRTRSCGLVAGVAVALALARAAAGARQDANEPNGKFPVAVSRASLPALQRLAQRTHLVIAVRNAGAQDDPQHRGHDLQRHLRLPGAATAQGTSAQAFAQDINSRAGEPLAAGVDRRPAARRRARYSCQQRRPGRRRDRVLQHLGAGHALSPGQTATLRLGRDRGPGREAQGRLAGRRRAERQGQGGARRRHAARGHVQGQDQQRARSSPTSTTRARSSSSRPVSARLVRCDRLRRCSTPPTC